MANEDKHDLGFGARVAQQSQQRLVNPDGSFNVKRTGLSYLRSLSPYHHLLSMSWTKFQALVGAGYLLTNLVFAFGYFLCGPDALQGIVARNHLERFLECFFFSVQTLATIGYGRINPANLGANVLVSVEALIGMFGMAMATGLLFARFSRPSADLLFSSRAIIAPFQGRTSLQFRIVNSRSNQLSGVEATVVATIGSPGKKGRKFHELKLDRSSVMFLPLHWVIVHPIDESSPLFELDRAGFDDLDIEVLVMIRAVDETFFSTVHARTSYKASEIEWNVKFSDMFLPNADGVVRIDVQRLDRFEPV